MMGLSWGAWIAQTLQDPRGTAERLISLNLAREHLWMALMVLIAVSTIVSTLPTVVSPPPLDQLQDVELVAFQLTQRPFILAFISFSGVVVTVFGLHWTGKSLGGTGRLDDMLVLLVWLQFIWLVMQVAVLVVALLLPALSGMAFLVIMSLTLWVYLNFIDVAHGYGSLLKVMGVTIVWVVGLTLGLSMILALLGVGSAGVNGYV